MDINSFLNIHDNSPMQYSTVLWAIHNNICCETHMHSEQSLHYKDNEEEDLMLNVEDKDEENLQPHGYSYSQDNIQPPAAPTQSSMANTTVVVVSIACVSYMHEKFTKVLSFDIRVAIFGLSFTRNFI